MSGTGIIRSTVPFIVGLLFVACGSEKRSILSLCLSLWWSSSM